MTLVGFIRLLRSKFTTTHGRVIVRMIYGRFYAKSIRQISHSLQSRVRLAISTLANTDAVNLLDDLIYSQIERFVMLPTSYGRASARVDSYTNNSSKNTLAKISAAIPSATLSIVLATDDTLLINARLFQKNRLSHGLIRYIYSVTIQ